jgi:hypothetical protein
MVRPLIPAADVHGRVEIMLGPTGQWRPVTGGYSGAGIWVVERQPGANVFVKAATTELTATFLRDEHAVYAGIAASCMPEMIGWDDDGEFPVLIVEDLSWAIWPPPWDDTRVEAVLDAAAELAAIQGPAWLPSWADTQPEFQKWCVIAEDPTTFLAGGLGDVEWLDTVLPILLAAESALDLSGDSVVHSDIRSDNLCLTPAAKLVDWNWTRRGPADIDVVAWLPSLHLEGGPPPWRLRPHADVRFVAALAGYFAYYAGQPPSPNVNPEVRTLQRNQAEVCLDWLAHIDPRLSRS